jgi:NAD(P)-dependent dehydrogenase (short-subunit alcohol dehydrogenase family)
MEKLLAGKTALVTGSSRGIGQQIAAGLAQLGCKVIVHGRVPENLEKTINILKEYNGYAGYVCGDLSDYKELNRICKEVNTKFSAIDIVYNNAAVMTDYHTNIWEHSWQDWEFTFCANVFSMYFLCSAFLPKMISRNYGRVVNLTSGIKNTPELAPYGASKAAVDKFTDDIASNLQNTGVRINTLDPGWLKTDMGGPNAEHPVTAVLPGALIPALIGDDGPNGKFFSAINYDRDFAERYSLNQIVPV